MLMVWFRQYFNYIVAVSFIGGGNQSTRRKPQTCRKSLINFIRLGCIEFTSQSVGFELTTLVVIGTDCISSCKSNCHTIMTTITPFLTLNDVAVENRPINIFMSRLAGTYSVIVRLTSINL
jgi:hypothetical protein